MRDLGDLADRDPGERHIISKAYMTPDCMKPRRTRIDAVVFEFEAAIDIDPIDQSHQQLRGLSMQSVLIQSDDQRAGVEHADEPIGPRDRIVSSCMKKSKSSGGTHRFIGTQFEQFHPR